MPAKYKNVESKVAKHIEGTLKPQPRTDGIYKTEKANLKTEKVVEREKKSDKPMDKQKLATSKSFIKDEPKSSRQISKTITEDSTDNKKAKQQQQTKFMNDKAAINFVDKLISDFKSVSKS